MSAPAVIEFGLNIETIGVILTGLAIIFGILRLIINRHGQLETQRERQSFLNQELKDRAIPEGQVYIRIDKVQVDEDTSYLKKFYTGDVEGSSYISTVTNFEVEDGYLQTIFDGMGRMNEMYEDMNTPEFEHLESDKISGNKFQHSIRVDSVDHQEILAGFKLMMAMIRYNTTEGDGYIEAKNDPIGIASDIDPFDL